VLIEKRPPNHPHMNCTPGISSLRGAVRVCTCEFDILALSFVCNTSVIRQPSTSGLVEIMRNSVSPYRSFGDASHTYTNPPSLSLALSPTRFHASLPPSVVLCYAHAHALPELFSPCNLPNKSGYGCIQVPSGEGLGPHLRTKHGC